VLDPEKKQEKNFLSNPHLSGHGGPAKMRTAAGYSAFEKTMLFSGTAKARLSPRVVSTHFRNRQRCGVPNRQKRQSREPG
jgi:hypothetical protein